MTYDFKLQTKKIQTKKFYRKSINYGIQKISKKE